MNQNLFKQTELDQLSHEFGFSQLTSKHIVPFDDSMHLFLVNDGQKKKLLKWHWIIPEKNIKKFEQVLWTCSHKKITPHLFPTQQNTLICQCGNKFYSLINYVQICPLKPEKYYHAIAKTIAKMHKALAEVEHDNIMAPLAIKPNQLKAVLKNNQHSDLISYIDKAEQLNDTVRWQLVHNDLHTGNIISSVFGKIFIIDYESFSKNPLVGDVLFAAFRLSGGYNQTFFKILEAYNTHNPLTIAEIKHGLLILLTDFIKKLGFILLQKKKGNDYYMKDYPKYQNFIEQTQAHIHINLDSSHLDAISKEKN